MAHVHTREGDPEARTMGTPEHFTASCRGHAGKTVQVYLKEIRGFTIPPDGVWFVNRLWNPPGTVRDLLEGDIVTFYTSAKHALDDRPSPPVTRRVLRDAAQVDPRTGAPIWLTAGRLRG